VPRFVVGADGNAQQLAKTLAPELARYWHDKSLPLPLCVV
jgi:hypothetical protein